MISRTHMTIFALAGAVLIAGALLLTAPRSTQAEATGAQTQPVAVEVTPVMLADVGDIITGVGNVAAMHDVKVSSETAGRVLKVYVDVGDAVKQGQILVAVDAELKEAAAEQARAQMLAAKTNLEKSKKDLERTQKLAGSGDVADVELEGYVLAYHAADAQYKGAVAALRAADRQVSDSRIKAPISGVVASRFVEAGEMVGPGMAIANIVDISSLKVKLSISEEDAVKLRAGQPAALRIDSRPKDRFVGTIHTVGAKSESPNGHTYPVEVVVQNRSKDPLKVGMFARVEIQASMAKGVLSIAKESLVEDGLKATVFVAKDGYARIRPVTLGIRGSNAIQVLAGLEQGELVISFGQKSLKDGAPVQFKQQ
jgi:membrane fusion protein (multidrug efflux system)